MSTQQTRPIVTIPAGQAISAPVDLGGRRIVGVRIPPNFEGTLLSFQMSNDLTSTGTFEDLTNDLDEEVMIILGSVVTNGKPKISDSLRKELEAVSFGRWIIVRSGSTLAPVVVAQDRPITLWLEEP